mmetsp:Transcript_21096/g.31333  ORF Transcript_21096/g.31333 Transcript_21096/m.31333 type:complete len:588 (-) Transcript_21096:52-1815(-)
MDNEAFRALVNEKSHTKTTKEIAREAVERDFEENKRRKRGRGRGGGGDSSSDEEGDDERLTRRWRGEAKDDDNDEDDGEPEWKKLRKRSKTKKDGDDSTKYRDRAKERREGKNRDYDNLEEAETVNVLQDEGMSKFLGGDERHTHLVKGLDLALADKVRREEMVEKRNLGETKEEEEIDLDQIMADATQKKKSAQLDLNRLPVSTSSLGQGMLTYLQSLQHSHTIATNKKTTSTASLPIVTTAVHGYNTAGKFPTAAGLAAQRSTFAFSTIANVGDVLRSWEIPRESIKSQQQLRSSLSDATLITTMPFDEDFMERIKSALAVQCEFEKKEKEMKKKKKHRKKKRKDSNSEEKNDFDLKDEDEDETLNESPSAQNNERDTTSIENGSEGIESKLSKGDESDEDIFADAGEYIPTTSSSLASKETKDDPNATGQKKKESIFSGLLAPSENEGKDKQKEKTQTMALTKTSLGDDESVDKERSKRVQFRKEKKDEEGKINRDIFGMGPSSSSKYYSTTKTKGGISISSYDGGYGEEMDVDFDGLGEEEEDGDKWRKKGKNSEETTMAAKEYGARGKRTESNMDDDGGGMI